MADPMYTKLSDARNDTALSEEFHAELDNLMRAVDAAAFKSTDWQIQCLAYWGVKPEELPAAVKNLENFCHNGKNRANPFAKRAVAVFVDRITAPGFATDFDTLSTIGITIGKCGFEADGIRCLRRAKEIL